MRQENATIEENPLKTIIDSYARKKKAKIIMHFPHSSLEVPNSFWDDVEISEGHFRKINLLMSDLHLLELFADWPYEKVVAPYSRLYVDVEKYWDEEKEEMASFGMGAVYSKDLFGEKLHQRNPSFLLEAKAYYDEHQEKLSKACDLDQDVLILDIHSFNRRMAEVKGSCPFLPDLCIGYNEDDSCPEELVKEVAIWAKEREISHRFNYPYAGAMYPNRTNGRNRIYSLMFEFNKRWYL